MTDSAACPVCGAARAPEDDAFACPRCGFKAAFMSLFASEAAHTAWKQAGQEYRRSMARRMRESLSPRFRGVPREADGFALRPALGSASPAAQCGLPFLSLKTDSLALGPLKPETHPDDSADSGFFTQTGAFAPPCIQVVRGGDIRGEAPEVVQFDTTENGSYVARLLTDGTVQAEGENDYGQCATEHMRHVTSIHATPRCLYGVAESGRVLFAGVPMAAEIGAWEDVAQIASAARYLVARRTDGTALLASSGPIAPEIEREIAGWRDAACIAAANQDDACLCLHADGSVSFAGRADDPRSEARKWAGMVAVAIESTYAVGLTEEGDVVLAGGRSGSAIFDMGRSQAADWKNVVAISCSRSGICALTDRGEVLLAGGVRDIERMREACAALSPRIFAALLQRCESLGR